MYGPDADEGDDADEEERLLVALEAVLMVMVGATKLEWPETLVYADVEGEEWCECE